MTAYFFENLSAIIRGCGAALFATALTGFALLAWSGIKKRRIAPCMAYALLLFFFIALVRILLNGISKRYCAGIIFGAALLSVPLANPGQYINLGKFHRYGRIFVCLLLLLLFSVGLIKIFRVNDRLDFYEHMKEPLRGLYARGGRCVYLDFLRRASQLNYYAGLPRPRVSSSAGKWTIAERISHMMFLGEIIIITVKSGKQEQNLLDVFKQHFPDMKLNLLAEYRSSTDKKFAGSIYWIDNREGEHWGRNPPKDSRMPGGRILLEENFESPKFLKPEAMAKRRLRPGYETACDFANFEYDSSSCFNFYEGRTTAALSGKYSLQCHADRRVLLRSRDKIHLQAGKRYQVSFLYSGLPETAIAIGYSGDRHKYKEILRVGCRREWELRQAVKDFTVDQDGEYKIGITTETGKAVMDNFVLREL